MNLLIISIIISWMVFAFGGGSKDTPINEAVKNWRKDWNSICQICNEPVIDGEVGVAIQKSGDIPPVISYLVGHRKCGIGKLNAMMEGKDDLKYG